MPDIQPMTKDKVMRPSLIDAVDKINEIITAVNAADMSTVDARLTALENADTTINGRIDAAVARLDTAETNIGTNATDLTTVKRTLYTPLSEGGA